MSRFLCAALWPALLASYRRGEATEQAALRMAAARAIHRATMLSDGRVLLAGLAEAELYDPATRSFRAVTATGKGSTQFQHQVQTEVPPKLSGSGSTWGFVASG